MRERIIAIDPGAERLGWAVMDRQDGGIPVVKDSGVLGLERGKKEEFQVYKLRLIEYWSIKAPGLFHDYPTTRLVNEILPAVGGGNFIAATQSELAKAALSVIQGFAYKSLITVTQIGATSVKAAIGGQKDASKAKVRNGVTHFLPELEKLLKSESSAKPAVWDRSDALAIGLAYYGLSVKR